VHVLATEFLWRSHADKRYSIHTKIYLGNRTREISGTPPAPHVFGIGPCFPYSLYGCVKNAVKNEVLLLTALICLVVGHWSFPLCVCVLRRRSHSFVNL